MTITCKYSCDLCKLRRVSVDVPARLTEPLSDWMESTAQRIANDHRARSPRCQSKVMSELLIPMTGRDKVGGPSVQ